MSGEFRDVYRTELTPASFLTRSACDLRGNMHHGSGEDASRPGALRNPDRKLSLLRSRKH